MTVQAIISGDVKTVLRLPPTGMQNPNAWSQTDSDIIGHLLQVQGQIQRSRWNQSNVSVSYHGDTLDETDFPEFEDFVYAAVYFRQFTAHKDDLLTKAVDRYRSFVDCPARSSWVYEEQQEFVFRLKGPTIMLEAYTFRALFDAFMYGASLMHKTPHVNCKHRANFLQIYDNEPRETVLFALNMSMKLMMNQVGNIAAVLYRDFGHWLHTYSLPRPDIRLHNRLFDIPEDT